MKKVLVIEDDDIQRGDLQEILGFEGYETIGAINGREGVSLAQKHKPHLIICDMNMPVLDGFGVIIELRQTPHTIGIPLIFLSARKERETIERGFQLGAVAYFNKPYILSELLAAVRLHIGD